MKIRRQKVEASLKLIGAITKLSLAATTGSANLVFLAAMAQASQDSSVVEQGEEVIAESVVTEDIEQNAESLITEDLEQSEELVIAESITEEDLAEDEESAITEELEQKEEQVIAEAPPEEPVITEEEEASEEATTVPVIETITKETASNPTPTSQQQSTSTVNILSPTVGSVLDSPATTIILRYPAGKEVELKVNGEAVDSSLIGRTETDNINNLITRTWYGVPLKAGDNTITANVVGSEALASVEVQVKGKPTQLTVNTRESSIQANGRSTATVQGQLLDENGNPSNWNGIVTLTSTAGEFIEADHKPEQAGFQVEVQEGRFTTNLRSSTKAQTVTIKAQTQDLEAYTQIQLETSLRPSLISGVVNLRLGARGTDFHGSFKDFLPADGDNSTQLDFTTAVFATGTIGEWLYTGAYNSERPLNLDCDCRNRLFREYQTSETQYSVYGDSSTSEVLTPSTDSLYLRLERSSGIPNASPDYFMWGDYNTDEYATKSQLFTALGRQLHGFSGNFNLGNLQISGFYANNVEGFQRDTISPDGTSGIYFLSERLVVPGSEDIYLEIEELENPGVVLQRERLNLGTDYEIDYDRGTLTFREPILRTDVDEEGDILVRRIVATYQYEGEGSDTNIYGGRLRYHFARGLNKESWLGATYLKEDQGDRDFELYGADLLVSLGESSRLIAEYAHSKNTSPELGSVSGSAYRFQLEGELGESFRGRAYYSSTDSGFSNDATVSFVPGQTRYGAELEAQLSNSTRLRAKYEHTENKGIRRQTLTRIGNVLEGFTLEDGFNSFESNTLVDNSLTTALLGIQQELGSSTVNLDWIYRNREDRINPDFNGESHQLRSRLTVPLTNNLTFKALNELTLLGNSNASRGDRTAFELDWGVLPGINVTLGQNFYTSGEFAGQSITSLGIKGDYELTPNTRLTGRYTVLGSANNYTGQGAIGLQHDWHLTPGLKLNLAYERVFGSFNSNMVGEGVNQQTIATGANGSLIGVTEGDSYSVGLEYTNDPRFKASALFEHRSSSQGSNTVISASALGRISPSISALLNFRQAYSANTTLADLGASTDLKLGLAYRDPHNDTWNALLKYEYRRNPATIPDTILFGAGTGSEEHLFSAEAIYAPSWRWEFYGKYAFRTSTTYLANDFVAASTVSLAQLRATYRLGYHFDLVGEARWIAQPSASYTETAFSGEIGYYITPNLRLAAGYSLGDVSDRDFTGSRSAGGPYVTFTVKLNDLFGGFGQANIAPPQQQESLGN